MKTGFPTMRLMTQGQEVKIDSSFAQEVRKRSGTALDRCYQCLTCSSGCPVVSWMDYKPNQVVRMVQYGLKDKLLASSTIWVCASCVTCATRCPNDVDIVRIMDTLREMAIKERAAVPEKDVLALHRSFLEGIESGGRVHELSLVVKLKLRTRKFLKDVGLGMVMFRKGKLKLFPEKIEGIKEVKRIFAETRKS